MRKTRTWAIIVASLTTLGLGLSTAQAQPVNRNPGKITYSDPVGTIPDANRLEVQAESVAVANPDGNEISVITRTFTPNGNKFIAFSDSPALVKVDPTPNVLTPLVLKADANQIKLQVVVILDGTLQYPVLAQGVLQPQGGKGKGGGPPTDPNMYWAVKVKTNIKNLTLDFDESVTQGVIPKTNRMQGLLLKARAMDNGVSKPAVTIHFWIKTDADGNWITNWFSGDTQTPTAPAGPQGTCVKTYDPNMYPTTFPNPPDGATKYIVQVVTDNNVYGPATLEIPIVLALWTERTAVTIDDPSTYKGFDPLGDPNAMDPNCPWVVVGIGNDPNMISTASALSMGIVDSNVYIKMLATPDANSNQWAAITPNRTSLAQTNTDVNGISKGITYSKAFKGTLQYARLGIDVKPDMTKIVQFVVVSDSNGHVSNFTKDDAISLVNACNKAWLPQARVRVNTDANIIAWKLTRNLGDQPSEANVIGAVFGDWPKAAISKDPNVVHGDVLVFIWWDINMGREGVAYSSGRVYMKYSLDMTWLFAHEFGHTRGIFGPPLSALADYPAIGLRSEDLMANYGGGYRIHKIQADIANPAK
jgi:hypothetical protein